LCFASFNFAEKIRKAAGMEEQSASSGRASEVREVEAARESIAEAKKDVKEAEDKVAAAKAEVAAAEAKVAAAEAKVAAAEDRVKAAKEGTNQEEWASAATDLQYAQESRQVAVDAWRVAVNAGRVAVDALESLGKSRAVREGILNNLLLQRSGAMQSHACTGFRKAMHSLGFCLRCATNLRYM
jgi:chromosome segregation ATPase